MLSACVAGGVFEGATDETSDETILFVCATSVVEDLQTTVADH